MKSIATPQTATDCLPFLSSQSQGWENILVEQFQHPPGEGSFSSRDKHTISLSLAPRPVRLLQVQAGKTYSGLYGKGDISITPARVPFFARWENDDHYLQIRLMSRFIQDVAREALEQNPDRLNYCRSFGLAIRRLRRSA